MSEVTKQLCTKIWICSAECGDRDVVALVHLECVGKGVREGEREAFIFHKIYVEIVMDLDCRVREKNTGF